MLRLALGLLAAVAALASLTAPARAQSFIEGQFNPAIPTLEAVAGHRPGQQITRPEMVIGYMQALAAAAPERVRLVEYATSWEGRPLVYAVISSPANMARLDAIKADMQALADGASPAEAQAIIARSPPVTWLGYGVHGNEISSSDAALALAYHLLAAEGDELTETILANTVVVIDPMQNPDGRARFTNSYYQQLGLAPSPNRDTAGHDEPWPGGRANHYLFDLNRDWFALTQPETRGKVAAVREFNPVVLVDAHEMGGDNSYYFPPNADPFNPYITRAQRDKLALLGRNYGAYLDRLGEPYFTREVYDAFYPGYGEMWPMLNGAIGMTFEQSSARGLVWERRNGELLTYADGVRNHFMTTLATAETVARNPALFLGDYATYRREAAQGSVGSGWFVIDLAQQRWNAEQLGRRLVAQGIAVGRVDGPATVCGRSYPQGYLSVSQRQPTARLIRSLLDRNVELPADFLAEQEARRDNDEPHELYDTTAWSVGLMSGLDVADCTSAGAGTPLAADAPISARVEEPGAFGTVVPWTDSGQARLVAHALSIGLKGRVTDEAFTVNGRTFPRGSVVFARGDNEGDNKSNIGGELADLTDLARAIGAETVALENGWVDDGPNLGSASFALLTMPRIATLWDEGISSLSAGATRYVIEQRFGLPVFPIRTRTVARADLSEFDVLIAPDGGTAGLGNRGRAAIAEFVREGGVLVAYGDMLATLATGDDALFATKRETVLGGEPAEEEEEDGPLTPGVAITSEGEYRALIADGERAPDTLPGALLNTAIDETMFLSAGYDDRNPVVFADGATILSPLSRADGTNVVRFAAPGDLVASGYVWEENAAQMPFKPFMMAQPNGEGMAIGFVHDPAVRGYMDGLDLLIANAVMIAPARVR